MPLIKTLILWLLQCCLIIISRSLYSPPAHPAWGVALGPWGSWGPASSIGYWAQGWRIRALPSVAGRGLSHVSLWMEWHLPGWLHGAWSADRRHKWWRFNQLIKSVCLTGVFWGSSVPLYNVLGLGLCVHSYHVSQYVCDPLIYFSFTVYGLSHCVVFLKWIRLIRWLLCEPVIIRVCVRPYYLGQWLHYGSILQH